MPFVGVHVDRSTSPVEAASHDCEHLLASTLAVCPTICTDLHTDVRTGLRTDACMPYRAPHLLRAVWSGTALMLMH